MRTNLISSSLFDEGKRKRERERDLARVFRLAAPMTTLVMQLFAMYSNRPLAVSFSSTTTSFI